jgi:hypothetical protein
MKTLSNDDSGIGVGTGEVIEKNTASSISIDIAFHLLFIAVNEDKVGQLLLLLLKRYHLWTK